MGVSIDDLHDLRTKNPAQLEKAGRERDMNDDLKRRERE